MILIKYILIRIHEFAPYKSETFQGLQQIILLSAYILLEKVTISPSHFHQTTAIARKFFTCAASTLFFDLRTIFIVNEVNSELTENVG